MEHFTTENWIDFVNQAVAANEKVLMEKHLEQGCKRCMSTVSLWQKVRQSAAAEGNYQPPEDSVRLAKAAFAGGGLPGQSPLRQFFAARFRRGPLRWHHNKANALSRGSFSDRCPTGS